MLCQDAHEAEDLVFRAFERAIERIDDFRPTGSFYYWVYTILLNFHRMDLRKRAARKETVVPNDELPEVEDKSPNPLEEFAFRGSAEAVRTAVRKLPERYREVVVLRYFEDLSTPEIAKIVGIPDGTVRSRLHYAKDALYDMLCGTELSPDFADRLVRATRPRNSWLFRHSWIACFVAILSFATLAAGTVAVLRSGDEAPAAASAAEDGGRRRRVPAALALCVRPYGHV
jgi:RNA polymerase sigma-70 factor (ECF subfamily)